MPRKTGPISYRQAVLWLAEQEGHRCVDPERQFAEVSTHLIAAVYGREATTVAHDVCYERSLLAAGSNEARGRRRGRGSRNRAGGCGS